MENKIFISPRLDGPRFLDHTLPVNILEDFTALEELLIEVAKDIYLEENKNRTRTPKGFSDGIYLKLLNIGEGSSIAIFAIASSIILNSSPLAANNNNFIYFEKAKHKIISIIESVNSDEHSSSIEHKYLSYFNGIGKNLIETESIDFGYNFETKTASKAILNKSTRKKLLLSREQKVEYTDNIKLFALISAIDKKNNTFSLETDYGKFICLLNDIIKETVFTAFDGYDNKTFVSLKGVGLYNGDEKLSKIEKVEYLDILDPLDVSLRIHYLLKLENNWYNGQGKSLNKTQLNSFGDLFNSYFDNKLQLPAIFPKPDGNIQLEWKKEDKNIIISIELNTLKSDFFYYNDIKDSEEFNTVLDLDKQENWDVLNKLIEKYI